MRLLRAATVLFVVLWSGVPVALMVLSSFKPATEIFAYPASLIFAPTLEHHRTLFVK
ncbi:MAG TPA: hypothetical protein VGN83_13985 [Falsiroseomonas sp.]|jgi:ABC-type glycerol-3-phosphate transport system permease component|nr:hypothetical protein [Falsiroseomonas sp.]